MGATSSFRYLNKKKSSFNIWISVYTYVFYFFLTWNSEMLFYQNDKKFHYIISVLNKTLINKVN